MRLLGLIGAGTLLSTLGAVQVHSSLERATESVALLPPPAAAAPPPESIAPPLIPVEAAPTPAAPEPPREEVRRTEPTPAAATNRRFRRRDRYWLNETFSAADWAPPEGPVRIGLQAGHWRAHEAPDELSGLRDNGTSANGKAEWEVNLAIAEQAAAMLREYGYEVDVLPAVVPPSYRAHLFISIHADGSADRRASGYRVAAPRGDVTGRAARVADLLEDRYGEATGLTRLPTVTRRMSNYYAFNFRRYQHALHPLTIGVILETGFLTSESDRRVIVDDPARAARGIVAAVTALSETPPPRPATALAGAAAASGASD